MYLHAKTYQNIPCGLKVIAIFTNMPENVMYKEICYLESSLVGSCQYVSACQTLLFYLSYPEL